ncbi:MAG: HDOD domain-containing protein [Planctomycetota bacterium]
MTASGVLQEDLRERLRSVFVAAKLPTSPNLAARILSLIYDTNSGAVDFGEAIQTDINLTTRLLRAANSPLFAQQRAVSTVERAVTVLGLNRIKSLALGFQLVSHLDHLGSTPFDLKQFWQHVILRACLARVIAEQVVPEYKEEAFLVGLLQDAGILLLTQMLGFGYAHLYQPTEISPGAFWALEKKAAPYTHVDAIVAMAAEWNLPLSLSIPLERHHTPIQVYELASDIDRLSAVGYVAGNLQFVSDVAIDLPEQSLRDYALAALGLDESAWEVVMSRAAREYEQVCQICGDVLPEDLNPVDLLNEANRQLLLEVDKADQRIYDAQAEWETIQSERHRLQNALRDYRERAAIDPLTGLLNRGALCEVAAQIVRQNIDCHIPVAIYFLDIDNFKALNDTHGHTVGDVVLRTIANVVQQTVQGIASVGRYGGEEFIVVASNLSVTKARELAEHLVQRVRAIDTRELGLIGQITCSIGAFWSKKLPVSSVVELFGAADQLMYQAKRTGKDRCCFELLSRQDEDLITDEEFNPDVPSDYSKENDYESQYSVQELTVLANQLNANLSPAVVNVRKEKRHSMLLPCNLHYFAGDKSILRVVQGIVLNISRGGIGVLIPRPLVRGEAVEVDLDKGNSKLYIAGLVAFCRHIDQAVHEIGIQFVMQSTTPILSSDPVQAAHQGDWIQKLIDHKLKSPN